MKFNSAYVNGQKMSTCNTKPNIIFVLLKDERLGE